MAAAATRAVRRLLIASRSLHAISSEGAAREAATSFVHPAAVVHPDAVVGQVKISPIPIAPTHQPRLWLSWVAVSANELVVESLRLAVGFGPCGNVECVLAFACLVQMLIIWDDYFLLHRK
jgi:hypothetical protein